MTKRISILAACILLAACNTIAGAGEDLQSIGETVTDAAN